MPAMPTTAKGLATRERILAAATSEFADRGLAGARMERITESAGANKAQLYAYFGSKEGLFDAIIATRVANPVAWGEFDATDLPGWAVTIYDRTLADPALVRLIGWVRLEQQPTGRWFDSADQDQKLDAIRDEQAAGRIRVADPFDILILVIGMATSWSSTSTVYTASAEEPTRRHQMRRDLLRSAVAAAIAG
jgi:AcrR family transcriptional regulator